MSVAQGNLTDYEGRTYDIVAYSNLTAAGGVQLSGELVSETNSGQICTGVQKLAQRFLLKFLKESGSQMFRPTEGNKFMTTFSAGGLRTSAEVMAAFSQAMVYVGRELVADEQTTTPDDEKFRTITLDSVGLGGGRISLHIKLTTVAGDTAKLILPLSVLPGG